MKGKYYFVLQYVCVHWKFSICWCVTYNCILMYIFSFSSWLWVCAAVECCIVDSWVDQWCIDVPCVWRIANRNATILLQNNIRPFTTPGSSVITPKRPKTTHPLATPVYYTEEFKCYCAPRNDRLLFTTPPTPPSGQLQPTLPTTSLKLRSTTPSKHNQFARVNMLSLTAVSFLSFAYFL